MPLRTVDGTEGYLDELAAHKLIVASALKVDLVEGEFFEPPINIELDKTEAELEIGETIELTAEITPDNATIDAVIWNSSDNRAATVDQDGVVTRVGPGSATIIAKTVANGLPAIFELTGFPMDYEVTGLSANEIIHNTSKDIEVTATFRNNISEAGYVLAELFYGGVPYLSEHIYFDGTPGQSIYPLEQQGGRDKP